LDVLPNIFQIFLICISQPKLSDDINLFGYLAENFCQVKLDN
jgi:hypothetical protein